MKSRESDNPLDSAFDSLGTCAVCGGEERELWLVRTDSLQCQRCIDYRLAHGIPNVPDGKNMVDCTNKLLHLAEQLGIDTAELSEDAIEDDIMRLRPEQRITAGNGDDREAGVLDGFEGGMAVVRWDSGSVTRCPIEDIDDEDCP